jgi:hypothetical protein
MSSDFVDVSHSGFRRAEDRIGRKDESINNGFVVLLSNNIEGHDLPDSSRTFTYLL